VRASRLVARDRGRAEALARRLGKTPTAAAFAGLVREASIEPNARKTAGDALERRFGDEPAEVNAFLFRAAAGEVGGPFAVPGGFALYRVAAVEPGKEVSFEAARPDVVRLATAEATSDYLKRLVEATPVRVDAAALDQVAAQVAAP
jgi:parvulin-like peptidyl-prolyl isomerase